MKTPYQKAAPKFFTQAHPVRNLGNFAHPPAQSAHRTTSVPRPRGSNSVAEDVPDFARNPSLRQNKRFDIAEPVNQQSLDASDNKTESYPQDFGSANAASTKRVSGGKPVKRKLKSGLDLFGKL